ncbi:hypothetical protein DSO57_1035008 [Entomophthora muscae]|nr:hypothetical protein DSO57_1035008 [Entomophthora muscae]
MDDVSLIYLNLSSTSPRKNPEKYMSFTALLDQKVPTGSLSLKDPSPFSGPSSLESSPNTILEEVEPVKSMEELDTHISKPVSIPSTENITPSISREAPELVQSIPAPEKADTIPNKETDDASNTTSEINPTSTQTASSLEADPTPNNETDNASNVASKIDPTSNQTASSVEAADDKETRLSRNIPGISLTQAGSHESSPSSTITLKDSHVVEVVTEKHQPGLFSTLRRIRKKAEDVVTSVKMDPAIMWLPTSRGTTITSTKMGAASSTSLRQFYEEASSHGQSMEVDEFGFIVGVSDESDDARSIISSVSSSSTSPTGNKTENSLKFDLTKEAKWKRIMNHWSPTRARKSYRVKKLVENGIPDLVRGRVWEFLANSQGAWQAGVYKELLSREKIPIYDVIERDIKRTYPKHAMFYYESSQGQLELHAILKAYAQYNPDVGYCQGMGMLVGLFLMQGLEAEEAFWLLVSTINQYLQGYFTPTLGQLRVHAAVFERLLEEHDPRLAKHLATNDITPLLYVTPWFLTVFTMTLPWASVLRVWDLFYYKGVKILFRVGLAIMSCIKSHVLKNCPSPAELLPFLLHIPHTFLEPENLMAAYKKVRITTSHIQSLCRKVGSPDGTIADRGDLKVRK